jgi:hypothetical protein
LTSINLLLITGFFGSSELLIRSKVEPEDIVFKHIAFFRQADKPDAVFGDSHTARSFTHPDFVNLGYPGDTIATMVYKIKRYYAQRKPGIVILQADPHMFSAYRQLQNDYLVFFDDNQHLTLRITNNYFLKNLLQYWKVFFSKGVFASNISFESSGAQLSAASWLNEHSPAERLAFARARVALHTPEKNFAGGDFAGQYAEIIAYLQQRGATIYLVTYPVTAEYRRFADAVPLFAASFDFFQTLAGRFGIRYINCFACIGDENLFADEDHLNKTGAVAFANLLIGQIRD